ncbi:glutathione S-transferase 3 isoform X2 [Bombina bombina]|nr:glutathione S-transferase 3 isoform X2 [Bombina bombina]
MFQQVPLVEIDGLKLVQTKAILNYIAARYSLYGKNIKERAYIDMYVDGTTDLMAMIIYHFFLPEVDIENQRNVIKDKAVNRYFPVYEKVLKDHGQDYLVGNCLSWADVHLLEAILMMEELYSDILSGFPHLKAFKERTSNIPTIKKFLQPGSQRKFRPDEHYITTVKAVLNM